MDNPTPRERMRAADSDRERVTEQLRVAHAGGLPRQRLSRHHEISRKSRNDAARELAVQAG